MWIKGRLECGSLYRRWGHRDEDYMLVSQVWGQDFIWGGLGWWPFIPGLALSLAAATAVSQGEKALAHSVSCCVLYTWALQTLAGR